MIQDTKVRQTSQSGAVDNAAYFFDPTNSAKLQGIMRNMYSNPVKACIREYCANAVDAHVLAGHTKAIEVSCPTAFSPTFKVRDYGPGLSVEDTKRLLYGFGNSSKGDTNTQIGSFGIGCKVGFAVATSFTYTIWHGGRKRIWSCFLDEEDSGQSALLSDEASKEPTGVEVAIPVDADKIRAFGDELKEAFQYYDMPVKIVSGNVTQTPRPKVTVSDTLHIKHADKDIPVQFDITAEDRNKDNYYRGTPTTSSVTMGGIRYPIEITSTTVGIDPTTLREGQKKILGSIVLHTPIGLLQLAPNREALQYSQRTKTLLNKLLSKVIEDGYVVGLFKSKRKADLPFKDAISDSQFYADMLREEVPDVLASLYPEYKMFVPKVDDRYSGKKKRKFNLTPGLLPETGALTTQGSYGCASITARSGYSIKDVHCDRWTFAGSTLHHENMANYKTIAKMTIVSTTEYKELLSDRGSWARRLAVIVSQDKKLKPDGEEFAKLRYATNNIAVLLVVLADDRKIVETAPVWTLVKQGVIEELPFKDLIAADITNCDDVYDSFARSGGRRRIRSGASKVAAHSRKFATLKEDAREYASKKSDNWDAVAAKDVTEGFGWAVKMEEFVTQGHRDLNILGEPKPNSGMTQSRDTMVFYSSLLRDKDMKKTILLDKPIVATRQKDYDKAVTDCELVPMGTRLKTYVKEYMAAAGLDNRHLTMLWFLLPDDNRYDSAWPTVASRYVFKGYMQIITAASKLDADHVISKFRETWLEVYEKALALFSSSEPEDKVFMKFFSNCCSFYMDNTGSGVDVPVSNPFINSQVDHEHWITLFKVLTDSGSLWNGRGDMVSPSILTSKQDLLKDMYTIIAAYPGLTAYVPIDTSYDAEKAPKLLWSVCGVKHKKYVSEISKSGIKHALEYVSKTKPMNEEEDGDE